MNDRDGESRDGRLIWSPSAGERPAVSLVKITILGCAGKMQFWNKSQEQRSSLSAADCTLRGGQGDRWRAEIFKRLASEWSVCVCVCVGRVNLHSQMKSN